MLYQVSTMRLLRPVGPWHRCCSNNGPNTSNQVPKKLFEGDTKNPLPLDQIKISCSLKEMFGEIKDQMDNMREDIAKQTTDIAKTKVLLFFIAGSIWMVILIGIEDVIRDVIAAPVNDKKSG